MSKYLFIESRDPFESRDIPFVTDTATELKKRGSDVTVFLVQNGVLSARKSARGSQVAELTRAGVTLLADDFSLRERGIEGSELSAGVQESSIDAVVGALAEGVKTVWH